MTTPTGGLNRMLGWVPAPPDPRTMKLSAYKTDELPEPPAWADWLSKVPSWPMYKNDKVGDCELAAGGHLIQSWRANAGNGGQPLTDEDILTAYSAVSGWDPVTGANDNGCQSLAMLNYWRQVGIGGHKIGAYVQINIRDHTEVKQAINLFGGILVAALLPIEAQEQNRRRVTWRPTSGPRGAVGSWGGHALHVGAYNARGLTAVTWGDLQRMTWAWLDTYGAEAYGIVSVDWINQATELSPTGLKMADLLSDLRRITC